MLSGAVSKFHAYAVIVQDIKDTIASRSFTIQHTLREGNHCADYMAKLGASSNSDFSVHLTPPHDLLGLLRNDAIGTFFQRA